MEIDKNIASIIDEKQLEQQRSHENECTKILKNLWNKRPESKKNKPMTANKPIPNIQQTVVNVNHYYIETYN